MEWGGGKKKVRTSGISVHSAFLMADMEFQTFIVANRGKNLFIMFFVMMDQSILFHKTKKKGKE